MLDFLFALDGTQVTLGVFGLATTAITAVLAPLVLAGRKRLSQAETKAATAETRADGAAWTAAVLDQKIDQKIGTPNGKGSVIQILERMHDQLEIIDAKLTLVDERSIGQGKLMDEHLKRYDRDHPSELRPLRTAHGGK